MYLILGKQLDFDRCVVTDVENCQLTQLPHNGIVDSSHLKKWMQPRHRKENLVMDSEGNIEDENKYYL